MPDPHPHAALREALGGVEPPDGIRALPEDVVADLADAIAGARAHQRDELRRASDESLGHVPRMLRGPVKKVLGL